MCFRKDHIADRCPKWKDTHMAVQYMASANKGLDFFHVVEENEDRFKL